MNPIRSAILISFSVATVRAAAADNCEALFRRADRAFGAHEEHASRTGATRTLDPAVLAYKNDTITRAPRRIAAASLVPTESDTRARLQSRDDVARDLPRALRDRVTSLHRGDVIVTSAGKGFTLGNFAGWGGTTHLFEMADDPRWLVRLPRAAIVQATNPGYANREEKTAFYYRAYRDTLERGRALGLPLLDARVEDGLIFVERFEPFESAIKFAHQYASERDRGAISVGSAERRDKLARMLRGLAGKPGVEDVFLDGIVWSSRHEDWVLADFADLRDEAMAAGTASAVYADVFADARARFDFGPGDLPPLAARAESNATFTRTRAVARPLRGIVLPIVTPLESDGSLDVRGLDRVIDRALSAGVSAVMVLGTTGEGASLEPGVKTAVIRETCRRVGLRGSVLVNVSAPDLETTLALVREARASGAGAITVTYLGGDGDEAALEHLRRVVSATTLPVFLYNAPDAARLSPEAVGRASEIAGVVGIKDSGRDLQYFRDVRRAVADAPDFSILVGSERLLVEALREGAHGGVSGSANVVPEFLVKIYRAATSGDPAEIARAAYEMREWKARLDRRTETAGGFVAFLKDHLENSGTIATAGLATGRR